MGIIVILLSTFEVLLFIEDPQLRCQGFDTLVCDIFGI